MAYVERESYEEPVTIPAAPPAVIDTAVEAAVEQGQLWLLSEPASIWAQPAPAGLITPDAELWPPPASIPPADLLPANLPHAWRDDKTTALALHNALSQGCRSSPQAGKTLPWPRVREAIDSVLKVNFLELAVDSGPWPCESPGAPDVRLRMPSEPPPPPPPPDRGMRTAEAELAVYELQDLAEVLGAQVEATARYDLTFRLRIELGEDPPEEVVEKANEVLIKVSEDLELE